MNEPLTGGCGCGAVRYQIAAPLEDAYYCHCTRCQRRSGAAAAASGRVAPGSFTITQGQDKLAAWEPPGGFAKLYCSDCGSALWAQSPDDPDVIAVRLGSVDGDPGIRPSYRQFTGNAAAWEPIPDDGLPRFPEAHG